MLRPIALKTISGLLALTITFASCRSTTVITSTPEGAEVYIDGAKVGKTPYMYEDSKPIYSSMSVRLEKEGYKPIHDIITRDEDVELGPAIAGFFVLIPWLWALGYFPEHHYYLQKEEGAEEDVNFDPEYRYEIEKEEEQRKKQAEPVVPAEPKRTKAERLRELKQLQEEGILTEEEFEREKQKILNEK